MAYMKMSGKCLKYIIILALFAICIAGCGESSYDYSEDEIEDEVSEPSYQQYVNTAEPDFSSISADTISDEEAEERVEAMTSVEDYLKQVEEVYVSEYGEITEDNVEGCLDLVYEILVSYPDEDIEEYVDSVDKDERSIVIHLKTGGAYVYQPYFEGLDAIGRPDKLQIATYQPYVSSYSVDFEEYLAYPDESAERVETTFDMYQFLSDESEYDRNYNDNEVLLENILRFSQNNLIIWHGHGCHLNNYGCCIGTGAEITKDNEKKYATDINDGSLLYSDGRYVVTPTFIRKHFADNALRNSIIYLGTCSSAADMSMVNVLLEKGAMAVIGNSDTIRTVYNLSMIHSVFEGLTQTNGNGYNSLEQALDYAKRINGDSDYLYGAETNVYYKTGYSNVTLEWFNKGSSVANNSSININPGKKYTDKTSRDIVLVLDRSGSMEGTPLEETVSAASQFVDAVLERNSRVAIVSYDTSATVDCDFSSDAGVLKDSIYSLNPGNDTNIYEGMENADYLLQNSSADKKIIVLMTDGLPNAGYCTPSGSYSDALIEYSNELMDKGIYIYTLGFFQALDGFYDEEKYAAQQMLEQMASPGCHYEIASAEDIRFFFDDIASQIGGTEYVYIRIACPVNVTVESDGEELSSEKGLTRTSFGSLTYEDSDTDDPVKVLRLNTEKDYDINISGYDEGTMDYTVMYQDDNGEYSDVRSFPDIAISDKTKCVSGTAKSDATYLSVDYDGDGKYDYKYKTKSNGTMEEVKDKKLLYVCLGIAGGIILAGMITLIIVLAVRSSKKNVKVNIANNKPQGRIVGLFGGFYGQTYTMTPGLPCVIGRQSSCDIQIKHKSVSKSHCTVVLMPNQMYQVIDHSSNGTYYNNQRLIKFQAMMIPKGALLVIGTPDNVLQLE